MAKIILMKFTSRERPGVLLNCVKTYVELAANTKDMVWCFSLDNDDPQMSGYDEVRHYISEHHLTAEFYYGRSESKIHAINRGVQSVKQPWDILVNISDDQNAVMQGYDDIIRNAMTDNLDVALWFNDGHQNRINTQEIVGRWLYELNGWIYHPSYKSFFCDNENTERFQAEGKIKVFPELTIIKHFHPTWMQTGGIPIDDLYRRNDKFWAEDEANYNARKAAHATKVVKAICKQ